MQILQRIKNYIRYLSQELIVKNFKEISQNWMTGNNMADKIQNKCKYIGKHDLSYTYKMLRVK